MHLNQVHKENLEHVENALPNRQGLEVEIFGMEGIPQEVLDSHRHRLIQNFYQAQEDRRLATGNPLPGQSKNQRKKIKIETAEELKRRLAEWRARRQAGGPMEAVVPTEVCVWSFLRRKCRSQSAYRANIQLVGYPFPTTSPVPALIWVCFRRCPYRSSPAPYRCTWWRRYR